MNYSYSTLLQTSDNILSIFNRDKDISRFSILEAIAFNSSFVTPEIMVWTQTELTKISPPLNRDEWEILAQINIEWMPLSLLGSYEYLKACVFLDAISKLKYLQNLSQTNSELKKKWDENKNRIIGTYMSLDAGSILK